MALALIKFNFEICELDYSIFVHTNLKGLKAYIMLFVGDFLISSEDNGDLVEMKHRLSKKYDMKDMGISRKFLGIQIEYGEDGPIKIYQEDYICDILAHHGMSDCNLVSISLDTLVKLVIATESEQLTDQKE